MMVVNAGCSGTHSDLGYTEDGAVWVRERTLHDLTSLPWKTLLEERRKRQRRRDMGLSQKGKDILTVSHVVQNKKQAPCSCSQESLSDWKELFLNHFFFSDLCRNI